MMGSTSYFYSHPPTQQLLHNVPFEELSSEGPQHHHPTSTTTSAAPSYFFYSSPGHSAGWSSEHSVDYTLLSPLKNEHQQEPLPEDLPSSRMVELKSGMRHGFNVRDILDLPSPTTPTFKPELDSHPPCSPIYDYSSNNPHHHLQQSLHNNNNGVLLPNWSSIPHTPTDSPTHRPGSVFEDGISSSSYGGISPMDEHHHQQQTLDPRVVSNNNKGILLRSLDEDDLRLMSISNRRPLLTESSSSIMTIHEYIAPLSMGMKDHHHHEARESVIVKDEYISSAAFLPSQPHHHHHHSHPTDHYGMEMRNRGMMERQDSQTSTCSSSGGGLHIGWWDWDK